MALYELARLDITEFSRGAVLTGRNTVAIHMNVGAGTRSAWVSPKPFYQCTDVRTDWIIFRERCFHLRINPIGLAADDVMHGEMDFQLSYKTVGETLGHDTLMELITICHVNGVSVSQFTARITFIGVFSGQEDGLWKFHGVIPMDQRLETIIVTEETIL